MMALCKCLVKVQIQYVIVYNCCKYCLYTSTQIIPLRASQYLPTIQLSTRHLFEYLIVHNYTLFVARVALCNDIHTQARNSYLVRRSAYQLMRQQVKSNLLLSSKIIVTRVKLTNRQTIWKIVKLKLRSHFVLSIKLSIGS